MKVFVWEQIEKLTGNYHSGGGAVVFAETVERAIELIKSKEPSAVVIEPPDAVRVIFCPFLCGENEAVYIMPDAGCC